MDAWTNAAPAGPTPTFFLLATHRCAELDVIQCFPPEQKLFGNANRRKLIAEPFFFLSHVLQQASTALRISVRPRAGVFKATPPGSPSDGDSLLDELGGSRARRASHQKASRHRAFDLLEGPSRRTGRRTAAASAASPTTDLREARTPLLGLLDNLGDRVSRRGGVKSSSTTTMAAAGGLGEKRGGGGTVMGAIRRKATAALSDMFEAPGRRVRRSNKTREIRRAAAAATTNSAGKEQKVLLGLISRPSSRAGRAERRARAAAAAAASTTGGRQAKSLLGILSGPGKRTGRACRDGTVAVAVAAEIEEA